MPCLFLILVLAFPRVVGLCLVLTDYLSHAYHNLLLPLIA